MGEWGVVDLEFSVLHQIPNPNNPNASENKKYMSKDGMYEAVYDKDKNLVTEYTDAINMGTFNFVGDYKGSIVGSIGHAQYDIVPWILYGTSEQDPLTVNDKAQAFGIPLDELNKMLNDLNLIIRYINYVY